MAVSIPLAHTKASIQFDFAADSFRGS